MNSHRGKACVDKAMVFAFQNSFAKPVLFRKICRNKKYILAEMEKENVNNSLSLKIKECIVKIQNRFRTLHVGLSCSKGGNCYRGS